MTPYLIHVTDDGPDDEWHEVTARLPEDAGLKVLQRARRNRARWVPPYRVVVYRKSLDPEAPIGHVAVFGFAQLETRLCSGRLS